MEFLLILLFLFYEQSTVVYIAQSEKLALCNWCGQCRVRGKCLVFMMKIEICLHVCTLGS